MLIPPIPPVEDAAAAEPVMEGMAMSMLEVPMGISMMGACWERVECG